MHLAVLTSGGDAPGMNAAIRAFVKAAASFGHHVSGISMGYEGLLAGTTVPLPLSAVDGVSRYGGSLLGSARSSVFPTPEGQERASVQLKKAGIEGLVVIGGNGSLTGAHVLAQHAPCPVVGIPASIDNDIGYTRLSIGVDTAVNTIVEACDRISDTATAHRRAFVVEVMGRHCGFLAMRAGIAADADAILYAERGATPRELIDELREMLTQSFSAERGKKRVLIVKSEGLNLSTEVLLDALQTHLDAEVPGVDIRATVLGHVVRGGSPSALDRLVAQRLAMGAARALHRGVTDVMMAWEPVGWDGDSSKDSSVSAIPLIEVLDETGRMLDGRSESMNERVALMRQAERLMAL